MNRAWAAPLVFVVLLAGCAPTPPAPTVTSTPTAASPSPTPTVELAADPEPLFDVACDELVSDALYSTLSTTALTPHDVFETEAGSFAYGIPYEWSLAQLQATQCEWRNDEAPSDENGSREEFTSLSVIALPNAREAWDIYASLYDDSPEFTTTHCNGADEINARCAWTGLIDDTTWGEITFEGMKNFGSDKKNVARFTPLIAAVRTAIEGASRGESWTVPSDTLVIEKGCPSVLDAEAIVAAVGGKKSGVTFYDGYIGGTSLQFEAERLLASDPCRWLTSRVPAEYGTPYQVLRGGQWAWEKAREYDNEIASAEALGIDGLADGDSAWIRSSGSITTVDLLIGGNWITIDVSDESLEKNSLDANDVLSSLAQSVVAKLRG
jgi:hypothetical protein